ncbi:cation transport protein-domain-containing protein [Neohortaea acidophila]|uniref:Cation transport protein-domain-containing protein n=1 Tax=Neohortaea acidophila TaxID=245834 RepID=A0A6A6PTH9_9PEZI|nr:cation transport protein-domain-containing protein [Neohortaea acidophila]KAF2483418.1 cation transport protein-domain-containing protein [Neohortaea acidophila]
MRFLRRQLPPLNFLTIHWMYFIFTALLTALIFWGSTTTAHHINFTNALFFTVSAMTEAGLNPVNLSALNTFQQVLLFLLILAGSPVFVSAFVVHVRKKAFERRFLDEKERRKKGLGRRTISKVKTWAVGDAEPRATSRPPDGEPGERKPETPDEQTSTPPTLEDGAPLSEELTPEERRGGPGMNRTDSITNYFPDGANGASPPGFSRTETTFSSNIRHGDISKYLPSAAAGWISRNSQFNNLTAAEREQLGGYEYRAIEFLSWMIPAYYVLWQLFGCIGCGLWVMLNNPGAAEVNALNPFWVGAFNAVSAFNNSGMSLVDANMVAFQRSYYMLITMSLLILAGNTAFPLFLRLFVWCLYKLCSRLARNKPPTSHWTVRTQTLKFLLDHPRRCYTTLFPSQHTWWLAASVFSLNAIDWAAFEILNINNKKLDAGLPLRYRVIDGLFQAFAVRSGGFYVVTIPNLRISLLVLYVVMMYISVYPVVITMRNSNVYEERSLGIYAEDQPDHDDNPNPNEDKPFPRSLSTSTLLLKRAKTIGSHLASLSAAQPATQEPNTHFIRHQLRAQLAHDAWFLVLALFLIMIIESSKFNNDPAVFSVFNFIFEIVSAYGCVGISIGLPYADYSFSGSWRILSKLILCAVMLRGRHRGLPVAIDKAVLLPGDEVEGAKEEEDGRIRVARTLSRSRWEEAQG